MDQEMINQKDLLKKQLMNIQVKQQLKCNNLAENTYKHKYDKKNLYTIPYKFLDFLLGL